MPYYIGIMSGTSLDGIDIALISQDTKTNLIDTHFVDIPTNLRKQLLDLCTSGPNELVRSSVAEQQWVKLAATGVSQLLNKQNLNPKDIRAIGSHGQTIRHEPSLGFSIQIGSPALLAELTKITVISHFRQRDLAAGGQGAPLVPAFHEALFSSSTINRAILNIGGFSNLTLLNPNQPAFGFDCGPGNVLMDAWIQQTLQLPYDNNGEWAAKGHVQKELLDLFLSDAFFSLSGPKSTGRELFNLTWINQHIKSQPHSYLTEDIQATLLELTAVSVVQDLKNNQDTTQELLVCGGGANNQQLLQRLQALLPNTKLSDTNAFGVPADWVEAMAFAWLAHNCLERIPSNRPDVTGANGLRVLGAIYPS